MSRNAPQPGNVISLDAFLRSPWLALVPAACFAALYAASRRRLAATTAAMWFLYSIYEYSMHRRWLCSGECNIRVDLLLLYPVMFLVSLTAAIVAIMAIVRRRNAASSPPDHAGY